jgi:hypothetical protein
LSISFSETPRNCHTLLAGVAPSDVCDEQLSELLTEQYRQLAYQQAQVWAVMAEIAHRDPMAGVPLAERWSAERIFESGVDEIRAQLLFTRRSARRELENADAVVSSPRVFAALTAGLLDRARAIVLAEGCLDLTDAQTTTVLDRLLPEAGRLTTSQLAERLARLAIALDPAWAERRYRQAVRERKVVGYLNPDGSAVVSGQNLPADQAAAGCNRVDALADAAKRSGAVAKIDQLRAEVFLGLLDGSLHGLSETDIVAELVRRYPLPLDGSEPALDVADNLQPAVGVARGMHLRVELGTLLGLDEHPGEIAGWGPVPASVARTIAARQRRGQWQFAIVDDEGQHLFDGISRRRPAAGNAISEGRGIVELHVSVSLLSERDLSLQHPEWAGVLADLADQYAQQRPIEQDPAARFPGRPLRRRMQIRFQRCLFAGCRRPAVDCDADHRKDYARGGRTDAENIAPGCRHDHELKTTGGWRLVRKDERTFVWISPLGSRHTVVIDPVAPPLPEPEPREQPPEFVPGASTLQPAECATDPPPY